MQSVYNPGNTFRQNPPTLAGVGSPSRGGHMIDPKSPHTSYITHRGLANYTSHCSCGWDGEDTHRTQSDAFIACRYHQQYWLVVEDGMWEAPT